MSRRRAGCGWRWAVVGLGVMAVLTPLGLLAPGGAFGEARRGSEPAEVPPGRGPRRPAALRGLLAPRAVQRLRLHARQAPGGRLPRVGRCSASLAIGGRRCSRCVRARRGSSAGLAPTRRAGEARAHDRRMTARHPTGWCRARSACARAGASASAARAASSRRRSAARPA